MLLPPRLRSLETHRLLPRARRQPCCRRRPLLEALEDRALLSTFTVSNTNDSGAGSLRDAIAQANNPGADTIVFSSLFNTPQTIPLTAGQLTLTDTTGATTITGPSVGVTIDRSTNASTPAFRIMQVDAGVTATLENLTITGGTAVQGGNGGAVQGGGILCLGNLTLSNVRVTNNLAQGTPGTDGTVSTAGGPGGDGQGGGVYASGGRLSLTAGSVISGNKAIGGAGGTGGSSGGDFPSGFAGGNGGNGQGGGVYVTNENFTISNSTLSGNSATGGTGGAGGNSSTILIGGAGGNGGSGEGGGVYAANEPVPIAISNSTLGGNGATGGAGGAGGSGSTSGAAGVSGTGNGGGINNTATLTLTNSTLSGNSATRSGGGIYNYLGIEGSPGTATLTNTIVGGNTLSGPGTPSDLAGNDVVSGSSHNLIGPGGSGGLSNGVNGNIVVGSAAELHLGPLANNGGPTQTMALLAGSPAINAGISGPGIPTTDQRGFTRVAAPDIGAYEVSNLIIVTTAVDEDNGTADPSVGTGTSLREAINLTNSVSGPDTIGFAIPGAGAHTINLLSALPFIIDPVVIDATSQPGFNPQTAIPVIELNGVNAGAGASGFVVSVGPSTIKGFLIDRFQNDGIILNSSGNLVADNEIGTDAAGTPGLGNQSAGIGVGGTNNTIGGTSAGSGNVISGNTAEGIFIRADGNLVQGNMIGTNAAGNVARGNGLSGITLQNSSRNQILGNLVSGNGIGPSRGVGILIIGVAEGETVGGTQNLVQGNRIGTNAAGDQPLRNFSGGIALESAENNTIGGTSPGQGNLISGNGGDGISGQSASNNLIGNNTIGLSLSGASLGNDSNGISLTAGTGNSITGNVISGNGTNGINGQSTSGNQIEGNTIGLNSSGASLDSNSKHLGNASNGISLTGGTGNSITGNVISANGVDLPAASIDRSTNLGHGIGLQSASNNSITGNTIGLNSAGAPRGNFSDGIALIGGTGNSITGNVISANGTGVDAAGINLTGNSETGSTSSNLISGNKIGTSLDGETAAGNSLLGIFLDNGVSDNTIGGTTAGAMNIISGNGSQGSQGVGVYLFGPATARNNVVGNFIGTDANGAKTLGVSVVGLLINEAHANSVQGNVISGNQSIGVYITGATASSNLIEGNIIGTDRSETQPIPNKQDGVFINDAPSNMIIDNLISANGTGRTGGSPPIGVGIQLFGQLTTGNVIQRNKIGLDATGNPTLPNVTGGILVDVRSVNNQFGVAGSDQANQGQTDRIPFLFGPSDPGSTSSVAPSRRSHQAKATKVRTRTVARSHPVGPSAHAAHPRHRTPSHHR